MCDEKGGAMCDEKGGAMCDEKGGAGNEKVGLLVRAAGYGEVGLLPIESHKLS